MNELQLVKSEHFGEIEADIYSNGNDMFMTIDQLAACLEYADRKGVEKLVERNAYLRKSEFSTTVSLSVVEGSRQVTRERTIFTEDGIYEITMLSSQPKAREFRAWIRNVLKALRAGKAQLVSAPQDIDLSPEIQMLKLLIDKAANAELEQKRQAAALTTVEQKVDGIREIIAINPRSWRDECGKLLRTIATQIGGGSAYKEVNAEAYQLVDERAGVSLATRLTNKRRRMADEGVCKSKRDRLNQLDVIQDDKKLIEIFIAVVKELALKYGVDLPATETITPGA